MDLAELDYSEARYKYVDVLRRYSEGQADYWRQLPYLKLLTDDRFVPDDLPPYVFGYYPIESTHEDDILRYRVWVDCATGQLIQQAPFVYNKTAREKNPHRVPYESTPADSRDICRIIPQHLNAKVMVNGAELKLAQAERLRQNSGSDPEMANNWHMFLDPERQVMIERVMQETGLRPIFTRNPEPLPPRLGVSSTGIARI